MPVSISGEWMKATRIPFDVRALASDYGLQRGFHEIGGKIARGIIFEVEKVHPFHQPLVVREAFAPDDHHRAEVAVAKEWPISPARHAGERDHPGPHRHALDRGELVLEATIKRMIKRAAAAA